MILFGAPVHHFLLYTLPYLTDQVVFCDMYYLESNFVQSTLMFLLRNTGGPSSAADAQSYLRRAALETWQGERVVE